MYLNKIKKRGLKREHVITDLRETFDIGEAYAATLYASHREMAKQNGTMIEIFSVRETKDGKPVKPYLKREYVFKAPRNSTVTPADAILAYLDRLKKKEKAALTILESL
jgi:hypothetical protein